MEIKQAVVVITGASAGIGEATARAASRAGARVVLLARREDRIQKLAKELPEALAVRCDVTDPAQVAHAVKAAKDRFGRIDVLINNAAQGLTATIEKINIKDFQDVLNLNLVAPLITMQAVLPLMRKQGGGSIVNVNSGVTFSAIPGTGAYCASKAGFAALSGVARAELKEAGIAVSTLFPFVTKTEFVDSLKAGQEEERQLLSNLVAHKPEQVAEKILNLVRTGDERDDLVPRQYGGTYDG